MERVKKILVILLSLIIVLSSVDVLNRNVVKGDENDSIEIGTHGVGITWSLNTSQGLLVFNGKGMMDAGYGDYEGGFSSIFAGKVKKVIVNEGIKTIDYYTFKNCDELSDISLPKSLVSVGTGAFYGCSSLKQITIPEQVFKINANAFEKCESLESVTILNPDCLISTTGNIEYIKKIYGYPSSTAENFANENNIEFVQLEGTPVKYPEYKMGDVYFNHFSYDVHKDEDNTLDIEFFYCAKSLEEKYRCRYQIWLADNEQFATETEGEVFIEQHYSISITKSGNVCSYFSGLENQEKYYLKIRCGYYDGEWKYGNWSDTITISTGELKGLARPYISGKVNQDGNFEVSWEEVMGSSSELQYNVYINDILYKTTDTTFISIPASYFDKNGEYLICVEAEAPGYKTSKKSNSVVYRGIGNGNSSKDVDTVPEATSNLKIVKKSEKKVTVKPAMLTKIKEKKKSLKIIWKKVKGIDGYQIQYSTSKKFIKAKKINIKSAKVTSKTIKKLRAKKKYYVRIRTYIIVSGKSKCSGWSKVKSQKTK